MTGEATRARAPLGPWLAGLGLFAGLIVLDYVLTKGGTQFGILDHQRAGSAARVDEIQALWRASGRRALAIASMIGDLVFIAVYGWGSFIAGRWFARRRSLALRAIGAAAVGAALVFVLADTTETLLQLAQLLRDRGDDTMAAIAAQARPVKELAWLVTFVGVLGALGLNRFSTHRA